MALVGGEGFWAQKSAVGFNLLFPGKKLFFLDWKKNSKFQKLEQTLKILSALLVLTIQIENVGVGAKILELIQIKIFMK